VGLLLQFMSLHLNALMNNQLGYQNSLILMSGKQIHIDQNGSENSTDKKITLWISWTT